MKLWLAFALLFGPAARAALWFDSPELKSRLEQIREGARQVKPAPTPTYGADAPVDFRFDPRQVEGQDLVIISVCGLNFGDIGVGAFRLEMALWYYHRLFPGRAIDRQTLAKLQQAIQSLGEESDPAEVAALRATADDDYMESALRAELAVSGKKVLVVPMPWTRNPQKSDRAIADFKAWLSQIYAAAHAQGKPVYLIAHSWGTLLTYETLQALAQEGSPVRVDKLITLGSPLAPRPWWVEVFVKLEEHCQGLERLVVKPANVRTWVNFWAQRDAFSNSIPVADGGNIRVDAAADPLSASISQALLTPSLAKLAAKDWASLASIKAWHSSYLYGYHRYFPSIQRQADIEVFGPQILPRI